MKKRKKGNKKVKKEIEKKKSLGNKEVTK